MQGKMCWEEKDGKGGESKAGRLLCCFSDGKVEREIFFLLEILCYVREKKVRVQALRKCVREKVSSGEQKVSNGF